MRYSRYHREPRHKFFQPLWFFQGLSSECFTKFSQKNRSSTGTEGLRSIQQAWSSRREDD